MIDDHVIPIVAIAGAFVLAICGSAFHFAYKAWKIWSDNALKRDMVARGYTAQEIIAVIAAERGADNYKRDMVANYYSADEIAAVVAAERRADKNSPLPNVPPAKPIKQPTYS